MSVGTDKVRPFTGGYVTDRGPWELKPDETPKLQDAVFTGGAAGLRGAWTALDVLPLPGSPAIDRAVVASSGGVYASYEGSGAGGIGVMGQLSSALATIYPFGFLEPSDVTVIGDEVVFAYGFGANGLVGCLVRYAGHTGALTFTGTGQATAKKDSPVVTFASATASDLPPVGSYIGISGVNGTAPTFRVVAVDSDHLAVAVDVPMPFDSAGQAWTVSSVGVVGVGTIVTEQGDATFPASAGYMTGRGTNWKFWTAAPWLGDIVGMHGSWGGATFVDGLIPNEYQMSVSNYMQAETNAPYAVVRPLCGQVVCAHRNRLYAASPPWADDLLQWTPVQTGSASLSQMFNGIDSPTTNYLDARTAGFERVPNPTAPGGITGLVSIRDGVLMVLRSTNAYRMSGEPPTLSFDLIHADAGCFAPRSACVSDEGAIWVGPNGVWRSQGGTPENLSEGLIGRELRELGETPTVGVVDGHLRVDYTTAGRTYWYDIEGKRWLGYHTGEKAVWQFQRTDGDVMFIPSGATVPALTRSIITAETTTSADDPGGTFIARTPSTRGDGTTGLIRPTQLTVAAEVSGDGSALDVYAGSSDVPEGQVGQIAASPTDGITVKRIAPAATGALGRMTRDFYVELRQDAAAVPSKLRVHQVDIRERRRRSKA